MARCEIFLLMDLNVPSSGDFRSTTEKLQKRSMLGPEDGNNCHVNQAPLEKQGHLQENRETRRIQEASQGPWVLALTQPAFSRAPVSTSVRPGAETFAVKVHIVNAQVALRPCGPCHIYPALLYAENTAIVGRGRVSQWVALPSVQEVPGPIPGSPKGKRQEDGRKGGTAGGREGGREEGRKRKRKKKNAELVLTGLV